MLYRLLGALTSPERPIYGENERKHMIKNLYCHYVYLSKFQNKTSSFSFEL